MTRHVSSENLARFQAGDLSTARSRRVEAHLRSCARCRATSEALAQVPSLLAAVQAPRMPAHLTARIETALAAESAHRAAGAPDPAPAAGAGARRGHRRPVMRGPALRILTAAGVAVILAGGVFELVNHSGGASSTSSASGSAASGPSRHKATSLHGGPQASSGAANGALPYQRGGHTAFITPVRSDTDYQAGRLAQQVGVVLAAKSGARLHSAIPDVTPNGLGSVGVRDQLGGCVSRVAAGRNVLLVNVARFDRKPATVIVTARQGPSPAQIWVVGPGCSAASSDVLAHRSLPAP